MVSLEVILEPEARDTAGPIGAACAYLVQQGRGSDIVLVSPCDHSVADIKAFHAFVAEAAVLAEAGRIVVFGNEPDHPATGYGYITYGVTDGVAGRPVEIFREKLKRDVAEALLATGSAL